MTAMRELPKIKIDSNQAVNVNEVTLYAGTFVSDSLPSCPLIEGVSSPRCVVSVDKLPLLVSETTWPYLVHPTHRIKAIDRGGSFVADIEVWGNGRQAMFSDCRVDIEQVEHF